MKRTVAKELGNITVTDYKFERRFGSSVIVKLPFMRKTGKNKNKAYNADGTITLIGA